MTDTASRHALAVGERIMEHVRAEGPMVRDVLLAHLRLFWPDMEDRAMRQVYEHLPIGRGPAGLFIPRSAGEVESSIAFYAKHAPTEKLQRYAALMRTEYSRYFNPENRQLTLGMEG